MPVNASLNRFPIDDELILRLASAGAQTNDGASTDSWVIDRDDSYWGFDVITDFEIAVVVDVDSIDTADTNETYTFQVQVDTSSAFGSATTIASKTITAAGVYQFIIPREAIVAAEGGAATHLRVYLDVGGTTPSCTWSAYISPVVGG